MKALFINAERKVEKPKISEISKKLPKKLHILYTIQYKGITENIKQQLEKTGVKITAIEQILGCSKITPKAPILLISSGKFHLTQALSNIAKPTPIYYYNAETGKTEKIGKEHIEDLKKKEKARLSKFYSSENIGMLISTKPGQNKLKQALQEKKNLKKKFKDKNFYIFMFETINLNELVNFPIDIWINFACPGLYFDSPKIINYKKLIIKK